MGSLLLPKMLSIDTIISTQLSLVSRVPYAAPAVGVAKIHQQEAKQLLQDTFSGL